MLAVPLKHQQASRLVGHRLLLAVASCVWRAALLRQLQVLHNEHTPLEYLDTLMSDVSCHVCGVQALQSQSPGQHGVAAIRSCLASYVGAVRLSRHDAISVAAATDLLERQAETRLKPGQSLPQQMNLPSMVVRAEKQSQSSNQGTLGAVPCSRLGSVSTVEPCDCAGRGPCWPRAEGPVCTLLDVDVA